MEVKWFDKCPRGFTAARPDDLYKMFGGPFVFEVEGKEKNPLVVSVLLHGNEWTGLLAIQNILKRYGKDPLPRSLVVLVGNTEAARHNARFLDHQEDFNRIWEGGETPFHKWAGEIKKRILEKKPFAAIDIHNNTGKNPYYGCINMMKPGHIKLASLFKSKLVYFTKPSEVFSMAFAPHFPATTIECGLSGEVRGTIEASDYIQKVLTLPSLETKYFDGDLVDIYHTTCKIKVHPDNSLCFGDHDGKSDFCFPANFEYFNFSPLESRTVLGKRYNEQAKLIVIDNHDHEVCDKYIEYDGEDIVLSRNVIPSMFTKNIEVVFQDCLGYLMESIHWEDGKVKEELT